MYEEIYKRIKEECLYRNRSELTCKLYIYYTSKFIDWLNKPLEEATIEDAREYILQRRKEGLKPDTCNGLNSALSFLYRHILHIPWDYDIVPRMKRDWNLPKVLSRDEIEKLIDTAETVRNKAIIALIYSSGLRVGEVCRLAPDDIYMSSMQVHIRNSKNHGDHWTILSKRTLELLKEYWYSYPEPRDILFVSERRPHRPLKPGGIQIMMRKVGEDAGIYVHPHILRHSFATHLIEDDTKREYVQSMLGHRSPNSTAVYVNVSNKSLMGVISPLDKSRNSKRKKGNCKKKSGGKKDE